MIKIRNRKKHQIKCVLYLELNTTFPAKDFVRSMNTFIERFKRTGLVKHFIPLWVEYDSEVLYEDCEYD